MFLSKEKESMIRHFSLVSMNLFSLIFGNKEIKKLIKIVFLENSLTESYRDSTMCSVMVI